MHENVNVCLFPPYLPLLCVCVCVGGGGGGNMLVYSDFFLSSKFWL